MTSVFVHLRKNEKPAFSKKNYHFNIAIISAPFCPPPPSPPPPASNFAWSMVPLCQLDFPLPPLSAPRSPRMSQKAKSEITVDVIWLVMQKYCAAEFTKFSGVFEHFLSVPPDLQGIVHKRKEIASGKCLYTSNRQSDKMDVQISTEYKFMRNAAWFVFHIHQFHIDHIMHLVYFLKCYITIIFDFSWDECNTQEKLETMVMQNFRV